MIQMSGLQRAKSAYKNAALHSVNEGDAWMRSIEFIGIKLKEAKRHNAEKNFEGAFNCHERINRIVAILYSNLPDESELSGEEAVRAGKYVRYVYRTLQQTLASISAKKDADERYSKLIVMVGEFQEQLAKSSQKGAALPTKPEKISTPA